MKIAVWKTGHEIADTVADALIEGINGINSSESRSDVYHIGHESAHGDSDAYNISIAYGILRGTGEVFKRSKHWFNIDNGYFNPGHFDGYYRISYKGTQAKWHDDIPQQSIDFKLEDWKPLSGKILVCPPTGAVSNFFNITPEDLWNKYIAGPMNKYGKGNCILRTKLSQEPIDWGSVLGVITFNSSIGWQALQRGIPVYSDPDHSIIGSYYKAKMNNPIDFLSDEYRAIDREPVFRAMAAHQFKLSEISEGKAWNLINYYLSRENKI